MTEFVADLAHRIAAACTAPPGLHARGSERAVPLPPELRRRDDWGSVLQAPSCSPAPEKPAIELLTPDGHMRPLGKIEADIIRLAICHYGGKVSEVARRLNISRSTLYRKLDAFGIEYKP